MEFSAFDIIYFNPSTKSQESKSEVNNLFMIKAHMFQGPHPQAPRSAVDPSFIELA